ncbi:phosphotransferase [Streptomyces cinereoruber]|uniref:phosphotransferase n=1 Tax=Streptomyces cinereoruber TaxID=67260 RepID=UPI00363DC9B0
MDSDDLRHAPGGEEGGRAGRGVPRPADAPWRAVAVERSRRWYRGILFTGAPTRAGGRGVADGGRGVRHAGTSRNSVCGERGADGRRAPRTTAEPQPAHPYGTRHDPAAATRPTTPRSGPPSGPCAGTPPSSTPPSTSWTRCRESSSAAGSPAAGNCRPPGHGRCRRSWSTPSPPRTGSTRRRPDSPTPARGRATSAARSRTGPAATPGPVPGTRPASGGGADRLADRMPDDTALRTVRNDWRLDDLVLDEESLRVTGVLDWEPATLGDPLMDLGSALAHWVRADDGHAARAMPRRPSHLPGMLTRAEIVERYRDRTGLSTGDWPLYEVFGLFRLAVIAQQIHHRYHHRQTRNQAFRNLWAAVHHLDHRCRTTIPRTRGG